MNLKHAFTVFLSTMVVFVSQGQIANDVCANAQVLTATSDDVCVPTQGSFADAIEELPADSCEDLRSANAYDQWFSFEAVVDNHIVDVETPATGGFQGTGAVVQVYDACGGNIIGCGNPEVLSFGGFVIVQAGITRVELSNLTTSQTYFVRVHNYGDSLPPADQNAFTICVHAPSEVPVNDSCATATSLTVNDDCQPVLSTINGATASLAPDGCGADAPSGVGNDAWFTFKPKQANSIIDVVPENQTGGDLAPIIELYGACASSAIACKNPTIFPFIGAISGPTTLNANGLDTTQNYLVRVYHYGDEAPLDGNFNICVYNAPPAPVNDSCLNATILTVADSCVATIGTLASANEEVAPNTCDTTSATAMDVWYSFEAASDVQIIEVNATGGQNGVAAVIELLDVCGGTLIDCAEPTIIPGFGVIPGNTTLEAIGLDSGTTYTFRVYHFGDATPDAPEFEVCVYNAPPPPANDECDNAISITQAADAGSCQSIAASTLNATPSANVSSCATDNMDDDVWYTFTAISDRAVAKATNKSFDLFQTSVAFSLYEQTCDGTEINCFESTLGDSALFTGLTPGSTYLLRVYSGDNGSSGTFDLCVYAAAPGLLNDECSGAIAVTATNDNTCNTITASFADAIQENAPDSCGDYQSANAFDTWYSFEALGTGHTVEVETTPPSGGFQGVGAVVQVYDACGGNIIGCGNPAIQSFGGFEVVQAGKTIVELSNLTVSNVYYIRIYNYGDSLPPADQELFTLCVRGQVEAPANDECANATTLQPAATCIPQTESLEGANDELGAVSCEGAAASNTAFDVWYHFTATVTSHIVDVAPETFSGTAVAPVVEIYSACGGNVLACGNPQIVPGFGAIPGLVSVTATNLTVGSDYWIRTYHYGDAIPADPNFTICVYEDPTIGIDHHNQLESAIYPNPATNKLHIQLADKHELVSVKIMNSVGKLVMESKQLDMDISSLKDGIYQVLIEGKQGVAVHTVLKQ